MDVMHGRKKHPSPAGSCAGATTTVAGDLDPLHVHAARRQAQSVVTRERMQGTQSFWGLDNRGVEQAGRSFGFVPPLCSTGLVVSQGRAQPSTTPRGIRQCQTARSLDPTRSRFSPAGQMSGRFGRVAVNGLRYAWCRRFWLRLRGPTTDHPHAGRHATATPESHQASSRGRGSRPPASVNSAVLAGLSPEGRGGGVPPARLGEKAVSTKFQEL
jgi:hypothetical protein